MFSNTYSTSDSRRNGYKQKVAEFQSASTPWPMMVSNLLYMSRKFATLHSLGVITGLFLQDHRVVLPLYPGLDVIRVGVENDGGQSASCRPAEREQHVHAQLRSVHWSNLAKCLVIPATLGAGFVS